MLPGSRWLVLALGLLAWTTFVIRSYQVFGPDSVYVQPFNSDSALPVLMANDDKIDLFRTYNYGQDQIGSWPFMTGQIVHRKTGYVWTPRSVFLAQVIWLACSVLLVAILCRGYGPLVGLFVAVLFALHPVVRHYFFVLNQRNAWQCTTLILAWFSLRQVSDRVAKDGSRSLLMILLLSLFSFLAIWLSTLSGPLLLAIAAIELFRLRMLAESNSMRRSLRQCVAILFLPILGAIAAEALLKAAYHRHALKHFGTDFKTPTEFDWGNLLANLGQLWQVFTSQPWWPLALWGMLASLVALGYLLIAAFARQLNRDSNGRAVADLLAMIAGCGVMAWGSSIIAVLFTWVRLNSYGPRYLAQTHMFGSLAGLCTIVLLGRLFVGRQAEGTLIIGPIFVVVVLLLGLKFPQPQRSPDFDSLKAIAEGLVEKRNEIVLLGGYWDTYVFASLVAPGKIIPVPADDQLVRTPWTPQLMQASNSVVVVHHVFPPPTVVETPAPYNSFGDGENPPSVVNQHGVTLRLAIPQWYQSNGYTFSLYNNAGSSKEPSKPSER